MNPEDPMQYDALASKLSALQPVSAAQLQAQAFYEAGKRATCTHPAPAPLKLKTLAASLALAVVCSTAAYYAGSQRSGRLKSDITDNLAVVELAQPTTPRASAASEPRVAEPEPQEHGPKEQPPSEQQLAHGGEPARSNAYARSVTPLLVSWFQLPHRDAEEYLRSVELRTRPQPSRSAVNADSTSAPGPTSQRPRSLNRQLPELDRLQFASPLREWLSM